ncbi:hypothetical protein QUB02_07530 [Microcoleus sp. D3_18_C1]
MTFKLHASAVQAVERIQNRHTASRATIRRTLWGFNVSAKRLKILFALALASVAVVFIRNTIDRV